MLRLRDVLQKAEQDVATFQNDPAVKKARRELQKEITLTVSALAETKQQVEATAQRFLNVMTKQCTDDTQRTFCRLKLATNLVGQVDNQIAERNEFAFCIGEFIARMGDPLVIDLMHALMHRQSMLLVPQCMTGITDDLELDLRMGRKFDMATKTALETDDEFSKRLRGLVSLRAAVDHVMSGPFSYLVHVLALPPQTHTVRMLIGFLDIAGHRMSTVQAPAFENILGVLRDSYIPKAKANGVSDAQFIRLKAYVEHETWKKVPEGSVLPDRDESSSYTRAGNGVPPPNNRDEYGGGPPPSPKSDAPPEDDEDEYGGGPPPSPKSDAPPEDDDDWKARQDAIDKKAKILDAKATMELGPDATWEEIRAKFKELALLYHSNSNKANLPKHVADEKFKIMRPAYEFLERELKPKS